jgi:hypothetical protein
MGLIVVAMAVLAVIQPVDARPADPSPARPQAFRFPFETGQLAFLIQVWPNGFTQCTTTARGSAFEPVAPGLCAAVPPPRDSTAPEGEPIVRVETVISLTRAGEAAVAPLESAGPPTFDTEAEIEVSPDGSVASCRIVREEGGVDRPDEAERPEGLCSDLTQAPPFLSWTGEGSRRGRMRLTVFNSNPA